MITEKRVRELMLSLGNPESRGLKQVLYQVSNEVEQKTRSELKTKTTINPVNEKRVRCTHPTTSSGSGYFSSLVGQCGRVAKVEINNQKLCSQHAGSVALKILINEVKK